MARAIVEVRATLRSILSDSLLGQLDKATSKHSAFVAGKWFVKPVVSISWLNCWIWLWGLYEMNSIIFWHQFIWFKIESIPNEKSNRPHQIYYSGWLKRLNRLIEVLHVSNDFAALNSIRVNEMFVLLFLFFVAAPVDSSSVIMLEQVVKECHDSFVSCFHIFYPTAPLKWTILCELLDQVQKVRLLRHYLINYYNQFISLILSYSIDPVNKFYFIWFLKYYAVSDRI